MRKLSYFDIKERDRNLNLVQTVSTRNSAGVSIPYLFESLGERYSYNNAKLVLENWTYLSKYEIESLDKVLETFLIICENDSISNIKNAAGIIEGKILHKVRDGKATQHLNNYKLGKFKIYNTKINNRIKETKNNVKNAINNKGKTVNIFHPNRKYEYDIYGKRYSDSEKKKFEEKEKTVKECFDSFIEISNCNDQCDRVLQNQKILSNIYNIDSKVRSCNVLDENSVMECIYELCEMIDGCDVSDIIKYNTALENIQYTMNKNCLNVNNSLIAEAVSNYFLFSRDELDEDFMHDMRYILEYSKFYDETDLSSVKFIYKEETEPVEIVDSMDYIDSLLENTSDRIQMRKEISKNKKNILKSEKKNLKQEKNDEFKKELNLFKLKNKKTIDDFKKIIIRFFASPKENIIKGIPDIFEIIRMGLVVSSFAVGPAVGLISLVTNELLKLSIRREEAMKILKEYDKQIVRYEKKAEKSNSEKADEKYAIILKKLKDERVRYSSYASKLFTEKEYEKIESNNNEDIDYTVIAITKQLDSLIESMQWNTNEIMKNINKNINNLNSEDIYTLTESVLLCPDVFDIKDYKRILENSRSYYRERPSLSSYILIDALNNCLYRIDKNNSKSIYVDESCKLDKVYYYNNFYQEVVNDTIELINSYNYNILNEFQIKTNNPSKNENNSKTTKSNNKFILSNTKDKKKKENSKKNAIPDLKKSGLSISSKLKIAQTELQRSANQLKDKEKTLSNKIDVDMDQFIKSAERALTNNNREAVIKGSLIPSASKCIKAAIVTGAAWLVNPALAVIGAIGAIGISKKLQRKERQLILDDIDIELEMCEKYLKIAEEKDDMKATRNLLQTKRALQRQQQRLKYSMSVNFDTPPKIKNNDEISESYVMLPELGG